MDKLFFLALVCCKQTVEGFTLFVNESQHEDITLKCKLHDDTKNITWCFVSDRDHLSCTEPDTINIAEMEHMNTEQKLEANKIKIRNLRNNTGMYFCAKGNVEASVFKTMLGSLKNRTTCSQLDQFLVLSRDTQNKDTAPEERYQGQTVTLQCTFSEITEPYKVFWIKSGITSQCLYSFSCATMFHNPDNNSDCCIEETYIVQSQTQDKKQSHNITLSNLTDSDAGMYICVVYILNNNHWAIASNITLKVNKYKSMTSNWLPTTLTTTTDIIGHEQPHNKQTSEVIIFVMLGIAVAAGMLGGLLCFIKRKKSQLSSNLGLKRDEDLTLQNDTVTPYAVFNRTEDMPEDVMKPAKNHKMQKDEKDNTEIPLYSLLGSKCTASSIYCLVEHDPRVISNEEMSGPEKNKDEGFVDNILYDSAN
ncbi:uncharacterized protein LOC122806918 [Protopterus annectens]|uniref:uncharacterized protein LOC122806918 n=1 Tax=Protopterus annectens TaxID=7888 RepID=UPI001CFA277E|nr:uncharacterized protein LOC122806918 [Protopterus annectens]